MRACNINTWTNPKFRLGGPCNPDPAIRRAALDQLQQKKSPQAREMARWGMSILSHGFELVDSYLHVYVELDEGLRDLFPIAEGLRPVKLFAHYVAPLAAIPAVCGVIGPLVFAYDIAQVPRRAIHRITRFTHFNPIRKNDQPAD